MNFDSGWEWSYWLNDVITARAAWNPHMDQSDIRDAMSQLLNIVVQPFGSVSGKGWKGIIIWKKR